MDVEFFPAGGTLIGSLRYGSTAGALPRGRYDLVDIDFDFWVRVPVDERIEFSKKIAEKLLPLGWGRCSLNGASPFHIDQFKVTRLLTLVCTRYHPYWMRLDIIFYDILNENIVSTKICDDTPVPKTWSRAYDKSEKRICAYPPKFHRTVGNNITIPTNIVYPFIKCKSFNHIINCPQQSVKFLESTILSKAEEKHCLAFPVITATRNCGAEHWFMSYDWGLDDDL